MKYTDLTIEEARKIVQDTRVTTVVNSLIKKGLVSVYENTQDLYKAKKETYIFLHENFEDENRLKSLFEVLEKKPQQLNIILAYLHLQQSHQKVLLKELLTHSGATSAQVNTLEKKEILYRKQLSVDRILFTNDKPTLRNELSGLQQNALQEIKLGFQEEKPVLLKGITGSGKTHIYIELIQDVIANGKQALYLLPEIALTAQIIRKLQAVFGNRIGVYHSRFSNNERVEMWKHVQNKTCDVIIGARSSLMLPFHNLGLIIIDEEHDTSYKQQEPAPRYHARDAAVVLAYQCKANVLLGSATPSLESYYNCKNGKYKLVLLTERFGTATLPNIELVDMNEEKAKNPKQGIFSNRLISAIQDSLLQKRQVILFQNRRGYSPLLMCNHCSWIPHCKYCDVALAYHKSNDKLHCHYCGNQSAVIKSCAACGNGKLVSKSFGTEKIEDDIKQVFPNARVQRFDTDSLRNKNKYYEVIQKFEKREIDILVGTQMLVKGLDFENVNLVAVLSADSLLSHPDFRVNERCFQLIEQVSGRAGRKDVEGRVLVQTYQTNHPILQHVLTHAYENFYQEEMDGRFEFQYPPFTRLIRITLKHKDQLVVMNAARQLYQVLGELPKTNIFGPAEPDINRIRNQYIQEILLKTHRENTNLVVVKNIVQEQVKMLRLTKGFSNVFVIIDVDPF